MSLASVTSTRRTTWPLMSRPRIAVAFSAASSASAASLTPPALPRPPVFTWAFTTTAVADPGGRGLRLRGECRPPPPAARERRARRRAPSPGTRTGPRNSSLHAEGTTHHAPSRALRGPAGRVSTSTRTGRVASVTGPPERPRASDAQASALVCGAVGVDITPVAPVADASAAPGEPPRSRRVDPGMVLAVASVAPGAGRRRLAAGHLPARVRRARDTAAGRAGVRGGRRAGLAGRPPAAGGAGHAVVVGARHRRGRARLHRLHRRARVRARGAAPRLGRVRAVRPLDRGLRRADASRRSCTGSAAAATSSSPRPRRRSTPPATGWPRSSCPAPG